MWMYSPWPNSHHVTGSSDLYGLPGLYYTQSDVCILVVTCLLGKDQVLSNIQYTLSSSVSLLGYAVPGVWHICAAALFPLVIIKVPINLLILKVGCQGIAAVDIAERSQWNK